MYLCCYQVRFSTLTQSTSCGTEQFVENNVLCQNVNTTENVIDITSDNEDNMDNTVNNLLINIFIIYLLYCLLINNIFILLSG